jgi:HEPN domain-containing protein
MLEKGDAEASGFFLQQSLEKYLKAFLLQHGWRLRKLHELDALLDDAVKHAPDLENFRDLCERISGYYFADRYPPLGVLELTCADIKEDLIEAERFILTMFPAEGLAG